jgi:Ca-activated chloride channel family protein
MSASRTLIGFAGLAALAGLTSPAAAAPEPDITVDIDVGEPVMIAGKEQTAYVKITIGGFELPADRNRSPVNLAVVLDRSSSMAGDKFEQAKEAALMVIDRLQPDDVISVISYDSTVEVLVPAQKASEKDHIRARIEALTPRGSTALFAGVTHGLEEVGKFLDPKLVNRIILVSDGQANVGPSSPNELGRLGVVAARQGISISTIGLGLGYNEDLMTQLAMASDGTHAFAENGTDLTRIFDLELGDVLSVVAQDLEIEIDFDDGIIPVRALGRDATITGRKANLTLSQLYAKQERHVVFEVTVPPGAAGKKRSLASVAVDYENMISKKKLSKRDAVGVTFTKAAKTVAAKENKKVTAAAVELKATEAANRAVEMRDRGENQAAEKLLLENSALLKSEGSRLGSSRLLDYGEVNATDARSIGTSTGEDWSRQRKAMRAKGAANSTQATH